MIVFGIIIGGIIVGGIYWINKKLDKWVEENLVEL